MAFDELGRSTIAAFFLWRRAQGGRALELWDAYRLLGLTEEERGLFVRYYANLRRLGDDPNQAARLALHALDRCDKRIARALGATPKAVNNCVRRGKRRHEARGPCALVRLIFQKVLYSTCPSTSFTKCSPRNASWLRPW